MRLARSSTATLTPNLRSPGLGVGAVAEQPTAPVPAASLQLALDFGDVEPTGQPASPVDHGQESLTGTGGILRVQVSHPTAWWTVRRIVAVTPAGPCRDPVPVLPAVAPDQPVRLVACGRRLPRQRQCPACRLDVRTAPVPDFREEPAR